MKKTIKFVLKIFLNIINVIIEFINYILPLNFQIPYIVFFKDTSYLYELEDVEKYKKGKYIKWKYQN